MNKVRVPILAVLALIVAACTTTPPEPAKPKGPNLNGSWTVTTETPMGSQDTEMTVTQTGEAIAGKLTSQAGSIDYTGKVVGNNVSWGFNFSAQGTDLRIDYTGVVEGDAMKGKAVFGSYGEGNFTAKKKM